MGKDSGDKKIKKEKKEKRVSDVDGVKKSKKEKKSKVVNGDIDVTMTDALEAELEKEPEKSLVRVVSSEKLVPFAEPLVSEGKDVKKVLRTVKKAAKSKTLRRGVKEVVKYLRKSPTSASVLHPTAIVIIAADISPMDVISHIPVLCEDHNIPYIFVKSRVELGEASATKRPTSVTLVAKDRGKKGKEMSGEEKTEWDEAWEVLSAVAGKAGKTVRK